VILRILGFFSSPISREIDSPHSPLALPISQPRWFLTIDTVYSNTLQFQNGKSRSRAAQSVPFHKWYTTYTQENNNMFLEWFIMEKFGCNDPLHQGAVDALWRSLLPENTPNHPMILTDWIRYVPISVNNRSFTKDISKVYYTHHLMIHDLGWIHLKGIWSCSWPGYLKGVTCNIMESTCFFFHSPLPSSCIWLAQHGCEENLSYWEEGG